MDAGDEQPDSPLHQSASQERPNDQEPEVEFGMVGYCAEQSGIGDRIGE